MYDEQDHIQIAEKGFGFGHKGEYKYRVMDRRGIGATHHTNSMKDAKRWLHKCREYWIKQDELNNR